MADNSNSTQKEYILKLTAKTEDFTRKLDEASGKLKEAGQTAEKYKQQIEKAGSLRGAGLADTITQLGKVSSEYSHVTSQLSETITQARQYRTEMAAVAEGQRKQAQEVADSAKKYETLGQALAEAKKKHAAMSEALERLKGDEAYQRLSASINTAKEAIASTTEKLAAQREELAKTEQLIASQEEAMRQYAEEQAVRDDKATEATIRREQVLQRLAKVQAELRLLDTVAENRDPAELFGEQYTKRLQIVEGLKIAVAGWEDALANIGAATENAARGQAELGTQLEATRGKAEEQRSSVSALEGALKSQQMSLEDLVAQQEAFRKNAGVDFSDGEFEQLTLQIEGMASATEEAGAVLDANRAKAAAMSTEAGALGTKFEQTVTKAETLAGGLGAIERESEALSQTLDDGIRANELYTETLNSANQEMKRAEGVAEKYKQQVADVTAFKGSDGLKRMASDLSGLTKDYQSQASQLEKAAAKMQDYGGKMDELAAKLAKQREELAATDEKIADYESRWREASNSLELMKAKGGKETYGSEYDLMEARVKNYEHLLTLLQAQYDKQEAGANKTQAALDAMGQKMLQASDDADKLTISMLSTEQKMAMASETMQTQFASETFQRKINALGESIANVGKNIAGRFVKGIKTAAKWLKTMGDRAAKAAKESKLLNGMSTKLGRAINGLGSMARRLLARLALRAVFQDIGNAMKALAKQFDDFNETMNGLGGSTKQLVAQMAAAFGSLIQQIAPILNQILDMLINFVNTVTQIFAVLGGSGTWRRAVRGAYDFSGAMDSAAGSAGGAADAQEELNRQLLGFDQINKLNEAKDSTGGGGGGGGGAGSDDDGVGAFQWVEEEVPKNNITAWVDKLREAFENHDWPGIGKIFADGINEAFSWIQNATAWENVGDKITSFIDNFASSFNTFISSLSTYNIGATIGGAINTISNTITELEDSINWDEIGRKIGEGLNGLADKLDLSKAAEAFTKKFNILVDVIGNFAATVNWDKIGTDIADALNTMFDTFNWEDAGTAISNFVTGMLTAIDDIIYKTDWQAVGESLGQMLAKIDWKEALAEATALIVDVFTGLFEIIGGMLDELLGRSSTAESYEEAKANFEEKLGKSPMTEQQVAKLAEQLESGERDQSSISNYVLEVVRAYQEMKKWEELINNPERTQHQSSSVETHGGSGTTVEAGQRQEERPSVKPNLPVLDEDTPYYIDEGGVKTTIKANKQLEKSTSSYASALDGTIGTAKRAEKASTAYSTTKNAELKTITRVTDGLVGANNRAETSTKTAAVRMSSSWSGAATSINYSVKPLTTQIPSLFEQAMRNSETKMKGAEKGLTSTATRISTSVGTTVKDSLKAAFAIDLTESGAKAGKSYAEGLKNSDLKTPSIVERVKSGLNFDLSGTGYTVGKSYGLALKDAIESTKIKTPQIVSKGSHTLSGTNVSAPRYAIEWYAQGGFPDVGQLFMSRENGPEMVGQIGGHTAVANNEQIVSAVASGVARAVGSVLSQNMSRDEQGGDLVVRIDSEDIYRAALKGQRKVNKRTNPVFATI